MSGEFARRGFIFQDLYLLQRALLEAANQFTDESRTRQDVQFAVEARTVASDNATAPWDVLFLSGNECEVTEVKSGQLSRDDRLIFWRRLRRETAAHAYLIIPSLVLDPSSGVNVELWQG